MTTRHPLRADATTRRPHGDSPVPISALDGNRILRGLPDQDRRDLAARLERYTLEHEILVTPSLDRHPPPLHQGPNAVPAIALVRGADLQPRLTALANGADDVAGIPTPTAEVGACVRALLKRCDGERLSYLPAVAVGDLGIDVMRNHVKRGEARPDLTSTEQAILFVLASNAGQPSAVKRSGARSGAAPTRL